MKVTMRLEGVDITIEGKDGAVREQVKVLLEGIEDDNYKMGYLNGYNDAEVGEPNLFDGEEDE